MIKPRRPARKRRKDLIEMSIKKSLLAVAVLVISMMGFASVASAAEDGTLVDVTGNVPIAAGTTWHLTGWTKIEGGLGSTECHHTMVIKWTSDTTGQVTNFSVPDLTKCKNAILGCTLTNVTTDNLPYHVTVTKTDFDVTAGASGPIRITQTYTGGFCAIAGTSSETFANGFTLTPLKTGVREVTNTGNRLGSTANAGEPIAGFEKSGVATIDKPSGAMENITASGELELTEATKRCTYKIL
jgi:hypothetical protein